MLRLCGCECECECEYECWCEYASVCGKCISVWDVGDGLKLSVVVVPALLLPPSSIKCEAVVVDGLRSKRGAPWSTGVGRPVRFKLGIEDS